MVSVADLIYASVKPIIRMYLLMGSGIFLARAGFLSVESTRAVSDLVLIFFMPALIFYQIVSNISISDIKEIGVIFLCAAVLYSCNAVIAAVNIAVNPVPKYWRGGALLAGILQNVSDLPIAYLQSIATGFVFTEAQGDKGVAYVIIWLAAYVLLQFNFGLFQLVEYDFKQYDRDHGKGESEEHSLTDEDLELAVIDEEDENDLHETTSNSNSSSRHINNESKSSNPESHENHVNITVNDTDSTNEDENTNKEENSLLTPQSAQSTSMNHSGSFHPSQYDTNGDLLSPISTISEEGSISSSETGNSRNKDLVPKPLLSNQTQYSDNSNRLQPILSHHSIVRIPSARSHAPYPLVQSVVGSGGRTSFDSASTNSATNHNLTGLSSRTTRNRRSTVTSHESVSTMGRSLAEYNVTAPTFTEALVREYSRAETFNQNLPTSIAIATETNLSVKDIKDSGKNIKIVQKYHLQWLVFIFKNFGKPSAIAIIVSLVVALIPWLKALFVTGGTVTLPNAPDEAPPLSFFMQYVQYSSEPCVPIGLMLLGATIGRLEVNSIPPGFWRCVLVQLLYRLCIAPIIGVFFVKKLMDIGWITDPMAAFVTAIEFGLPSATIQVYITASNMTPDRKDKTQMDCLAIYVLVQYACLVISLPFLVVCMLKLILKV